jgi:hypothetical protein
MQQDYLAAPEPWAAAEKWGANTMDMANCLLELRARVEALEGLHSYKIGKAEPIENWGKGHTLVNPKPPSLKEQAHWRPSMTDPYRAMCAELVNELTRAANGLCNRTANANHRAVWAKDAYQAADRARALLDQPEPPELTDEKLLSLVAEAFGYVFLDGGIGGGESELLAYARAAIAADRARYGRPTPQPEPAPVAESPADGEVAELVARLKAIRSDYGVWHSADCQRAAALLEALPTPEALDD